jgi:hypothetical protein
LSKQQQALLSIGAVDIDNDKLPELMRLELQLNEARHLLGGCMRLLTAHFAILWASGRWQPKLQLLQQGGGEVLLQGLTLAVHYSSLHCQMRTLNDFNVSEVVAVVYSCAAGKQKR